MLQAAATTSLNPGILVQKFSNLKGRGFRGPEVLERSSGQWSEGPDGRAFRMCWGKARSQASLQKHRSSFTMIDRRLSLLQVNFLFCKWISFSSQWSRAKRKRVIRARLMFPLLFVSSPVNHVEISQEQPALSRVWLESSYMPKEGIF